MADWLQWVVLGAAHASVPLTDVQVYGPFDSLEEARQFAHAGHMAHGYLWSVVELTGNKRFAKAED